MLSQDEAELAQNAHTPVWYYQYEFDPIFWEFCPSEPVEYKITKASKYWSYCYSVSNPLLQAHNKHLYPSKDEAFSLYRDDINDYIKILSEKVDIARKQLNETAL